MAEKYACIFTPYNQEIRTLQDLESAVGKDDVFRLFTEYVMTLVGKAGKLDEVKAIIDNNGTIEDIRRIL